MQPSPPHAPKRPLRIEQHGRVRTDDYAWMRDDAWQRVLRDPSVLRADIREHLEAENAYTAAVLAETEPLQATILAEMRGRIQEKDSSVPVPDGPWEYYDRIAAGAQHPVFARRPRSAADGEQVLLDVEAMAEGHAYFRVAGTEHSLDHRLYAWAEDSQGSEVYRVRVRDIETGAEGWPSRGKLHWLVRHLALLALPVLGVPRRQRPAPPGDAPPDWWDGGPAGVRGTGRGLLRERRDHAVARVDRGGLRQPGNQRVLAGPRG